MLRSELIVTRFTCVQIEEVNPQDVLFRCDSTGNGQRRIQLRQHATTVAHGIADSLCLRNRCGAGADLEVAEVNDENIFIPPFRVHPPFLVALGKSACSYFTRGVRAITLRVRDKQSQDSLLSGKGLEEA